MITEFFGYSDRAEYACLPRQTEGTAAVHQRPVAASTDLTFKQGNHEKLVHVLVCVLLLQSVCVLIAIYVFYSVVSS